MKINQRVVSLGGNCMVAQEMRNYFKVETANLFDWWITPGDALVRLIEQDFEDLFEPENLRLVGDAQSVANLRYGNLHHHDFPRDDERDRVISMTPEDFERNQSKFAYLKKRWDELGENECPVLFIRYGWHIPTWHVEGLSPGPLGSDAGRLVTALDRKFPRLDYRILLIDAEEAEVRHPKLLSRRSRIFAQPGEYLKQNDLKWKDNAAIFSRIFSTVKVAGEPVVVRAAEAPAG
jgi:hypothetical protein